MKITAGLVKELRALTGAGMMDCKKALQEADGDLDTAVDNLRKSGAAKAAKKAGRIAAEGLIGHQINDTAGVLVEVNCETDFVARNPDFIDFVNTISQIALREKINDLDALKAAAYADGKTVDQFRESLIATLGENINIRRLAYIEAQGQLAVYLHGQRIGVLVDVQGGDEALAKDLAMHVAASHPVVVKPEDVPEAQINREKEIFKAQALESGKPEEIIEKMITGRLRKFVDEVSLLGQAFVKDPNTKVGDLLKSASANVVTFVRYEVGEGIEKQADDFVAEVMAQARGE